MFSYIVKNTDPKCVLHGRRHAALPPGESGASSGDDPHGGAEGEAGHCQKDATLLSDLSAGVTGGRRKDYRARGHNCRLNSFACFIMAPRANGIDLPVFCRAEKKIMNAASKLAAMAKVLETPIKNKSGKNYSLQSESYCAELDFVCFVNISVL